MLGLRFVGLRIVGSKVLNKVGAGEKIWGFPKLGIPFCGGPHIIWIIVRQYVSWEQTTIELNFILAYSPGEEFGALG